MLRVIVTPILLLVLISPILTGSAATGQRPFANFSAAILNIFPKSAARFPATLPKISGGGLTISDRGDYNKSFFEKSPSISFDMKEVEAMLQNRKKVAAVPEILANLRSDAARKDAVQYAKDKHDLLAWRNYYLKAFDALGQIPVKKEEQAGHLKLLGWMRYNADFIGAITQKDLGSYDLARAAGIYQKTFNANSEQMLGNLSDIKPASWNALFLNQANAVTGIPFGGIIAITDVCTTGELLTVEGAMGGAFFLYWTVYAANPFLYKAVYTSNWILGSATPGPGACNKGTVTYAEGEGVIQYFGTSLTAAG